MSLNFYVPKCDFLSPTEYRKLRRAVLQFKLHGRRIEFTTPLAALRFFRHYKKNEEIKLIGDSLEKIPLGHTSIEKWLECIKEIVK